MGVTKYVLVDGSGDHPAPNDKVRAPYLCYLWGGQNQQSYHEEKQLIIHGDQGYKEFRIEDGSVISGSITLGYDLLEC
ncbi:hypothetical protein McanMca71_005087 [Microsporum canis]